jgi:hypothetical protein
MPIADRNGLSVRDKGPGAAGDVEVGRLFSSRVRALLAGGVLLGAVALALLLSGRAQDAPGLVFGTIAAAAIVTLCGVLLMVGLAHLVALVTMPAELVVSALDTASERREHGRLATSLAGSPAVDVMALNADKAFRWGLFSIFFPPVGPVGIWYGRDALHFIRMSGGALQGERRARLGLRLGVVGTAELALLFALIAMYPTK